MSPGLPYILFMEGLLHVGAAANLETSLENPAAWYAA